MTQHTCAICNTFVTKNARGEWEDKSGIAPTVCSRGKIGERDVLHIVQVNTADYNHCSYCKKHIVQAEGGAWHSPGSVLPQYCYADPVDGSRLHTPTT